MKIQMYENYCCGGGHCGVLPGYDFKCPECSRDSYAQTGEPLYVLDEFSCSSCGTSFQVTRVLSDNHFEIAFNHSPESMAGGNKIQKHNIPE